MMYFNKLWIVGRRAKNHYIRFFPNPGFMFTFFNYRYKYSKFYGWKKERV